MEVYPVSLKRYQNVDRTFDSSSRVYSTLLLKLRSSLFDITFCPSRLTILMQKMISICSYDSSSAIFSHIVLRIQLAQLLDEDFEGLVDATSGLFIYVPLIVELNRMRTGRFRQQILVVLDKRRGSIAPVYASIDAFYF